MKYLDGNRFVFEDECPDFPAETVLSGLGFPKDLIGEGSSIRRDFDLVSEEVRKLIRMSAGAVYFRMPDRSVPPVPSGPEVVGVILTLGNDVTQRSDEYFAHGEYTKGMILNEIADLCLISYEKMITKRLEVLSDRKGISLGKLYERPEDMPVLELKYVWQALNADSLLGVHFTRESTLFPVKSSCFIKSVEYKEEPWILSVD